MKTLVDWAIIKPWRWFLRQTTKVKIAVVAALAILAIIGHFTEPKTPVKVKEVKTAKETTTTTAPAKKAQPKKDAPTSTSTSTSTTTTTVPAPSTTTTTSPGDRMTPSGDTCDDLTGMYESAMDTYRDKTSGISQNQYKAQAALQRAAAYQNEYNQYCH